jgi:hypothetical protein
MFRPSGHFAYRTQDGSETVSATASLGLLHWYMRNLPQVPESTSILEITPLPTEVPGPYHPMFLTLVISAVERNYGASPKIPVDLLSQNWYSNLQSNLDDFKVVVQAYRSVEPKVFVYEETCLNILKWLERNGDVAFLETPN